MTLTKAALVEAVWKKTGSSKAEAIQLVEALFETMKQTLESGEHVLISGFGRFSVREKAERKGRNPQTGEPIMLAPEEGGHIQVCLSA